ncbi:MAG: hypothetical protein R2718_04420 [Solirubrobacterales bacterium]
MRIREHLSYANVAATLALVGVIGGGGAYAASKIGSSDIRNGSIRSADLKNKKAVRGIDVKPNALGGRQIKERSLDISSLVAVAGDEPVGCNPGPAFATCAEAALELERPAQLLAVATGGQESVGGPAKALCQVRVDGAASALSATPGEEASDNTSVSATNGFARTVVTPQRLAAGRHVVSLGCQELSGDARIENPTLAVLAVRGG